MKRSIILSFSLLLVAAASGNIVFAQGSSLTGAWQHENDTSVVVMICTEKYFSAAVYSRDKKEFYWTCGGSYRTEGGKFIEKQEFNTRFPDRIGKEQTTGMELKRDMLAFNHQGSKTSWKRVDDGGPGKLAGAWLITGRMVNGNIQKITPGARRTMKILSGKHFQWIAYNAETKEFFGTGGGTYTTEGGKYRETIEFFSRDNSRVGKTLEFDFETANGDWRHKGLSSKGDPIDEVWTKREKIGL